MNIPSKKINVYILKALTLGLTQSPVWAAPSSCSNGGLTCTAPSIASGGSAYRVDNRAYAGLSWQLDGANGLIPDFILGARSLNINSSNSVNGADFNVRLRYKGVISFDSVRLSYVGGSREFMGNAGLGYSFTNSDILGTVAAQAAYSRLGVDYLFNKGSIKPYLEGNSLYAPKQVNEGTGSASCGSGDLQTVTANPPYNASASQSANGQTCALQLPPSDRRLKRSISLLTTLPNGIKIYSFKYLWSDIVYVGVMAQDLLEHTKWKEAVVHAKNGFYAVNYEMLGLRMKTIEDWNKEGLAAILATVATH
jgi:hypothetical protein